MQFSGFMDPLMLRNTNWEIVAPKWNRQRYSTYSLNLFKVRLAMSAQLQQRQKGLVTGGKEKGKQPFFFFFSFQLVLQGKGLTQQVGSQGPGRAKAVCNAQTTGSEHTHPLLHVNTPRLNPPLNFCP